MAPAGHCDLSMVPISIAKSNFLCPHCIYFPSMISISILLGQFATNKTYNGVGAITDEVKCHTKSFYEMRLPSSNWR